VEPYVELALLRLAWSYRDRHVTYRSFFPQDSLSVEAWCDSVRRIYKELLTKHPDSRIARNALARVRFPEVFTDQAAEVRLYSDLARRFPNDAVGQEAARLLHALGGTKGSGQ
jgi:hypothetical protein